MKKVFIERGWVEFRSRSEHGGSYQFRKNSFGTVGTVLELFFSSSTNLELNLELFSSSSTNLELNSELFFSSSSNLELNWNCFSVPVPTWNCAAVPELFFRSGTVGTVFFWNAL